MIVAAVVMFVPLAMSAGPSTVIVPAVMMFATLAMLVPVAIFYNLSAALVTAIILLFAGITIITWIGTRRPLGTPVTWGEAFLAGTFVFALMLLSYGIIPHQWLDFADNKLLWRSDKFAVGISFDKFPVDLKWGHLAKQVGGSGRILVTFQAVRDMIAAGFYIIFLGGQMALWSAWQKRGRKQPELELSSAFGRPVVKARG
jgi:hypothetical protein